jgi:hypothetical protein
MSLERLGQFINVRTRTPLSEPKMAAGE